MAEQEISALRLSFGRQCRTLREFHKMTREQVAEPCAISASMIGAVERGERIPDTELIHSLDRVLQANGLLTSVSDYMAAEKYREFFRDYAALERGCYALNSYAPLAIPGLLQTEAYARAMFKMYTPALSEEEIEKQVAARLERQELLKRVPEPFLGFIIEESVLLRPVGGKAVLKEQLLHLADCARKHFITVQVMPTDREEHVGLHGYLTLLTSKEHRNYAYVEHQNGNELISDKKRVALMNERYGILRAQALSPQESARFIEKLAGEL
ncbi:helix-turn-helix domain-containing protein [Streptomyces litchfieldiae]|uniref:Helix-turn-helix transcriptional regulator n=1 Tax=Streptomyces litchfieldiae TaxID=3075543 RepID=A0ABU2MKE0_9ACTN|nr:helix-turn-helix transcriptional regulator [Streptomyces sp. DSM 44938]MDT0342071.1 helix-turn-helix transcriptional regulator [Streptomyces sp. DSM 44938]